MKVLLKIIASGFVLSLFCGTDAISHSCCEESFSKNPIALEQHTHVSQISLKHQLNQVVDKENLSALLERNEAAAFSGRKGEFFPTVNSCESSHHQAETASGSEPERCRRARAVNMLRTLGRLLTLPN